MFYAWLLLTVPWVGLQCVIVVFPDHTRLIFFIILLKMKIIHGSTHFLLAPDTNTHLFITGRAHYCQSFTVNSEIFARVYFRETSHIFVKIKSSRNADITLSFTNMRKSWPSREF